MGICQLLGEIASDTVWDIATRQQAIGLLGQFYKDDGDWGQDGSINPWMLTIIDKLSTNYEQAVSATAAILLQKITADKISGQQHPYPLRAHPPVPNVPPILVKVQEFPDVDYDLYRLRMQRLQEARLSIYIPPIAKANLQAKDDDLFPLMDKVQEFLASDRQVMLILGDSGSGKSTFNTHLESELLQAYKSGKPIPLFINLPAIDLPDQVMIAQQLKYHNFDDDQIREMKLHQRFILICDGCDKSQQLINLHRTNMLNQTGQWNVKMIISCRSQYLGQITAAGSCLKAEVVIAPFSKGQIESYVDQYVPLEPRTWTTHDYMDKLTTIPNLMDLVKNPFLFTLALEALPDSIKGRHDLSTIKLTRVLLYKIFVVHWLEVNKRSLENNTLSVKDRATLEQLVKAGFT
ncbi:hypothetical protein BG015_008509 [Linnemannia schmuckeri]|uniref:NACHT domain-containing protein n=1 Tax=Linnemannia schmuckeri TaxID=64567 RepID=A0A9P5S7D9_9FUNG|nr:hypothetical protein BG015_008509 [Linnemannia schmuckeri]